MFELRHKAHECKGEGKPHIAGSPHITGRRSPGLEIRVYESATVRRADKEQDYDSRSYAYAVDNRFAKDPDF